MELATRSLEAARQETDAAVVARVQAGERDAFEVVMRRYNQRLYRLARATLRDDTEAEDALQDAYIAAFRGLSRFRGDASLSTWLSRLVLNECLGRKRRAARRDKVVPMTSLPTGLDDTAVPDTGERPDAAALRAQVRVLLEHKLDELPEDYRSVFVLRSVEDLSVEATAECLGVPEATVRSRHFRARSLLREALSGEFDTAERSLFEFGAARCDRVVARVLARLAEPQDQAAEGPGATGNP